MRPEAPRGIFGEILGTPPEILGSPEETSTRTLNLQPESGRKRRWPAYYQQTL